MSEDGYPEKKNKSLNLRGGQGVVRQNFSHGRVKSVVVETKRKKLILSKPNSLNPSPKTGEVIQSKQNIKFSGELERKRKALEAAKGVEAVRKEKEVAERKKRDLELEELRSNRKAQETFKEDKKVDVASLKNSLPSEPIVEKPRAKPEKSFSKNVSLKKSRSEDEENKNQRSKEIQQNI